MKSALGMEQASAARVSARKFDGGLDALAAGTTEEDFGGASPGIQAEAGGQISGKLGHVALQHGWPAAIELILEGRDDGGVIVPGIVDRIAGEKIENAPAIAGIQFGPFATLVADVHLKEVEKPDPLGIYVIRVSRTCDGGNSKLRQICET